MQPPPLSADELHKVSFDFNDTDGVADSAESSSSSSSSASRRHTIAARPRKKREEPPPPLSAPPTSGGGGGGGKEFSRPKLSPPDVMLDSLYATVDKKNRRYPAPSMPAPPPPYEGKGMKDGGSKKTPSDAVAKPDAENPERSISPPGYEPVSAVNTATAAATKGRGARLPPGRPSRPPAGNCSSIRDRVNVGA